MLGNVRSLQLKSENVFQTYILYFDSESPKLRAPQHDINSKLSIRDQIRVKRLPKARQYTTKNSFKVSFTHAHAHRHTDTHSHQTYMYILYIHVHVPISVVLGCNSTTVTDKLEPNLGNDVLHFILRERDNTNYTHAYMYMENMYIYNALVDAKIPHPSFSPPGSPH